MGNTFDRIPIKEQARGIVSAQRSTCALACLIIALLALLLGGATAGVLAALLSGLLQVAQSGFFLRMWRGESVGVADMLASMADDGFLRKVGGMLWVQLQVFLYSLLLIVPGLMRAYSLALTPYILADCPNVSATQASALSARMMYGHRMELFIAQLSFFGWLLLSGLTGGFSIMGVTIGLALAALLTAKIEKVSFLDTLDCVVPGLLMALALSRFGEGATMNGTGFEVTVPGLQFAPIARVGLYGESTYAVHMGEALVALIAAVYTQTLGKRGRGFVAGVGIVIVACAQIFFESARRDEVLKIDFLRDVMAFAGIVLLCVLIPSLRHSGWKLPRRILAIVGFVALLAVCALVEFLLDGKIYQNMPFWFGYLTDAVCLTAAAAICCRALKAACEKE